MRTLALSAVALSCTVVFLPLASYAQAVTPLVPPAPAQAAAPTGAQPVATSPAPARVAAPVVTAVDSGTPPLPLDIQSSNGVTYVNGGVGDEELAELKGKAKDFNLHVMLSAPEGEYISDVSLQLVDSTGTKLVSINDAGPYFYAHLRPGSYTLETWQKSNDDSKKAKIEITAKGIVSQHFVYKQ